MSHDARLACQGVSMTVDGELARLACQGVSMTVDRELTLRARRRTVLQVLFDTFDCPSLSHSVTMLLSQSSPGPEKAFQTIVGFGKNNPLMAKFWFRRDGNGVR